MLDVYIDDKMLLELFKRLDKKESENSKRFKIIKIEEFVKSNCNLCLDKSIISNRKNPPHHLTKFTHGMSEHDKPKFDFFSETLIEKAKNWSFFLLSQANSLKSLCEESFFTATEDNFMNALEKILFLKEGQHFSFSIIPDAAITTISITGDTPKFEGWKTISKNNLLPLTDVVIVDPYFLMPAAYETYYKSEEYDFIAYANECILPLIMVLKKYAINEIFNLTVFTNGDTKDKLSKGLFDFINNRLCKEKIKVNFSIAIPRKLGFHQRYIFTNYLGIDTKLSLHAFTSDKVIGNKIDSFEIHPYSMDSGNTRRHIEDQEKLAILNQKLNEKGTVLYPSQHKSQNKLLIHAMNVNN